MDTDKKLALIKAISLGKKTVTNAARDHHVARKTIYIWLRKYKQASPRKRQIALNDQYKKGDYHPRSVRHRIQTSLQRLISVHPDWGCRVYTQSLKEKGYRVGFTTVYRLLRDLHSQTPALREVLKTQWVGPGRLIAGRKVQIVEQHLKEGKPISRLARQNGVARKTIYEWLTKYRAAQFQGRSVEKALVDGYVAGESSPIAVYPKVQEQFINEVILNPSSSHHHLAHKFSISPATAWRIFNKFNLNTRADRLLYASKFAPVTNVEKPVQTIDTVSLPTLDQLSPQVLPGPPPPTGAEALAKAAQPSEQLLPPILPEPPAISRQLVLNYLLTTFKNLVIGLFRLPLTQRHPILAALVAFAIPLSVTVFVVATVSYISIFLSAPTLSVAIGYLFASVALGLGMFFFLYSFKYYASVVLVLMFSRNIAQGDEKSSQLAVGSSQLELDRNIPDSSALLRTANYELITRSSGLIPDISGVTLDRHPFVSIHLPLYNEKRVVNRLLEAVTSMDYPNFEVIVADDSTDETKDIVREWQNHPRVKISHRDSRQGFKGGALREALKFMDKRTEFVLVFDSDFLPYPDTITQFLKYFQATAGTLNFQKGVRVKGKGGVEPSSPFTLHPSPSPIAAIQGYQWHVLNKSENWITRGVRSEYAGSYVVERSGAEIYGGLKQIAGSVYMIRADLLKQYGWGDSITEDFELTLKLYRDGYKVVYTPYIQAPSECVSTLKRLVRQRMRWAEGHSHNIKRLFWNILLSNKTEKSEKFEFLYLSPYYLQSFLFLVGTLFWFLSETVFQVRLPFWTAVWGWSLVLTNILSLPLMNMVGMFLEEAEEKDYMGLLSFVLLTYIVAPFQAYASVKGFLETEEGPWFRTPKTGKITDIYRRGKFYRWLTGIFGQPSQAPSFTRSHLAKLNANQSLALRNVTNIKQVAKRSWSRFVVAKAILVSVIIFSLLMNYLALGISAPQPVEAKEGGSGPTKLGESTALPSPDIFEPKIEPIAGKGIFSYQGYTDDDNLVFFGWQSIAGQSDDTGHGRAIIRIVSNSGKYLELAPELPVSQPRQDGEQVVYEFAEGLIILKMSQSQITTEIKLFEKPSASEFQFSVMKSEGLTVRQSEEKGWQIVDESNKETVFFLEKSKTAGSVLDAQNENLTLVATDSLFESTYQVSIQFEIRTNPSAPFFDVADRRSDPTSDYNFEVRLPKEGGEVKLGRKNDNSIGYKFTTADNLYNLEMTMRDFKVKKARVEGNKVTFQTKGMDVEYEIWTDRVKANYVLKERPSEALAKDGYHLSFDLSDFSMIPKENDDGSISFWGDDGYGESNNKEVFKFDTPTVVDARNKEGKAQFSLDLSLSPVPLVPSLCQVKDISCKEPPGYYIRSGSIYLKADQEFLKRASYPITIDPTTLTTAGSTGSIEFPGQRHILINSDNDLVAFYLDSGDDIHASYSNNNGSTWTDFGDVYVGTVTNLGAAIDSSDNVHISFDESTDVKYMKITEMKTTNDIDGVWNLSAVIALDLGTTAQRPNIVIDKNSLPAVSWAFETSGGTKNSAVRFSVAKGDPLTTTNWDCATNSSCAYVKDTNCSTDVCGDHINPQSPTNVNSNSFAPIAKAPSTAGAGNADELVLVYGWTSNSNVYTSTAEVSGTDYLAWTTTSRASNLGAGEARTSTLSVDDGTNQRVWAEWDSGDTPPDHYLSYLNVSVDPNTWTNTATKLDINENSLAYDAQNKDIYIFFRDSAGDDKISFRKYDIASDSMDSANQLMDIPLTAENLQRPTLKENNTPTTAPGPKLDLIYMNDDGAMTPTFTVFYHTWHTKETRNYDNPAALSTTSEALTITSADNNLSFFYDEGQYTDSNSDDDVYVPASTSTTTADVAHTFKKVSTDASPGDDEIQITWKGKKVTENCASGVAACTLEIFEWGKSGCTAGWDTLGTPNTTTAAGTEFTLTGTTTNTCYYSGGADGDDHLGDNTVAVRVQTDCSTNCNLQTDVITFIFVPENVLWLMPLTLFLPRIIPRIKWRERWKAVIDRYIHP